MWEGLRGIACGGVAEDTSCGGGAEDTSCGGVAEDTSCGGGAEDTSCGTTTPPVGYMKMIFQQPLTKL